MSKYTAPIFTPPSDLLLPTGVLAETSSRRESALTSAALAQTTGMMGFSLIVLRAGWTISNISFLSGASTPAATSTHVWFCLVDKNRVQLATTTDDTAPSPWAVNTLKTLAIAQIASGASATYTVPATDYYYIGCNVTASQLPNGTLNNNATTASLNLSPILAATSETISTGPPAFAKTYSAFTAVAKQLYGQVS